MNVTDHALQASSPDAGSSAESAEALEALVQPHASLWDYSADPVALPPGVELLMGDVSTGSETPSMVRKILQWKSDHPEGGKGLWHSINEQNGRVVASIQELHKLAEKDRSQYGAALVECATKPAAEVR